MSIEETKTNNNKLIFGGIFLGVISLVIIVCLFIFMSNCDSDYCTISDSVQDQITNTRVAIGISAGLLFLFGILHVSARTEKMKNIVHSTMFSGSWANVLFPVLSLTLLVSSIYLYTIVNGKNFVCIDDTGSTKSKRNSRYTSITTPINVMIGMSVLLLISSIFVLYKFWKKTDEEKLADAEKAKASLSKIDDKMISDGPVSLHKKLDEIELSLSQANGLYEDELDNAQIQNLIESVKLKKNALDDAISRKKSDIETQKEKTRDILSSRTKLMKQQQENEFALHEFNGLTSDKDKFDYFCKIKKEGDNPDLLKKLQDTSFYKDNSKKLDDVCSVGFDMTKSRDEMINIWDGLKDNDAKIMFLKQLCGEQYHNGLGKLIFETISRKYKITLGQLGITNTDYDTNCIGSAPGTIGSIGKNQERQQAQALSQQLPQEQAQALSQQKVDNILKNEPLSQQLPQKQAQILQQDLSQPRQKKEMLHLEEKSHLEEMPHLEQTFIINRSVNPKEELLSLNNPRHPLYMKAKNLMFKHKKLTKRLLKKH
jgi:hypothetical protein